MSADGRVLYRNRPAAELPGWACEVGRPLPEPLLPVVTRGMAKGQDAPQDVQLGGRSYSVWIVRFPRESYANVYGRDITDRKKAEEALRQLNAGLEQCVAEQTAEIRRAYEAVDRERQRFYDVLEALPVYVVLLTPDYHVPFANRFFRERFGEAHGQRCFEYLFRRTEPCEICETYKVLKTNAPHHWEWTGPDGRNYDIFDFPFMDTDGSPLIMEMGIDITERKLAEEALKEANETLERRVAERTAELRESQHRLAVIVDSIADGFFALDREWRFTHVNDAALGHFRKTRDEVLGCNLFEVFPAARGTLFETEYRRAMEGGKPVHFEAPSIMADLMMAMHVYPGPESLTILFRDVTERHRMAEALQALSQQRQLALDAARMGWWHYDPVTRIASWDDRFKEVFGVSGYQSPNDEILKRLHPEDVPPVWAKVEAALDPANPQPYSAEYRMNLPDGSMRWINAHGIASFEGIAQDRRAVSFVGTVADITGPKQAEEALRASEKALRQANEQLEEKVRERTAELTTLTENLLESRDQLRSFASELVVTEARERRALASVLHDTVAQMLAIAKLTLEATGARLEGKSRQEVTRVVQLLQEASRQTRSLMADLSPSLLYEAGLGQALRVLGRRMGELHSLAIEVVDDGSPKPLGEDYRVLLFRAVQELLHNTVKHAKATTVKVSLERDGGQVRIEVEDDGVGFLVSPRGRGEGMREGFGLFSIRERLRHLGGSFDVFSQPGRGVRAVLVVPLQVEKEDEGREPAAVRILIVEDHRMMRDALASLLEKQPGFEVVGLAKDGLEAVRLAREVRPDVVLMDVNLPRMDGLEATRQIAAELPEIKVIGLSVQAEPQTTSKMLAAGATSFVAKNSSPEELTKAIRSAVGSTGGA